MRRYSRSAGDGVGCDEVRSHEARTFVDGGATASTNQAYKQTLAAGRDDTVDTNGSERSRGELVDKCNRNLILAIMLSGLMAFGVAAEAQDLRVEVVGGAGIFLTKRPATAWAEGGSTVWMRRLGVGSSHSIRHDGTMTFVTTFHVRYRIEPSGKRPELIFGGSPLGFRTAGGGDFDWGFSPILDFFAGWKISPRFSVRFGMLFPLTVLGGEEWFICPMGLGVWSFGG